MQSLTTEPQSSSQGDSSIKTRYGSRMLTPWNLITTPKSLEWKPPSFPLLFSLGFPHVTIYFYFIWNCDFHGAFAYQSFNFQHFYEYVSENHWVFLVQNTKKLLQHKKRWDGLLLCLVHAGFSKKCKEERALGRHDPCFMSLATKTPYTLLWLCDIDMNKVYQMLLKAPW
jgi:hypothetical protein